MKKYLTAYVVAFLLACASSNLLAQEQHRTELQHNNELYISYGRITAPQIAAVTVDAFGHALATGLFGSATPSTVTSSGAISAGYLYHPNRRIAVGLSGTAENIRFSYTGPLRSANYLFYTVLVNGRFYYINKPSFGLYSGLRAGYAGAHSSPREETGGAFALQVNMLGFSAGRDVAAFAELGYGYQGMVQAGISVRF